MAGKTLGFKVTDDVYCLKQVGFQVVTRSKILLPRMK